MKKNPMAMSLRTKTILLLSAVFIFMLLGTVGILRSIMLHRLEAIETSLLQDHLTRTRNAIDEKIHNLEKIAFDWGVWDDTYAFIEDHNEGYAQANLVEEVYANLDLDAMVFIDDAGQFVYAQAVDPQTGVLGPIPQDLQDYIESSVDMTNRNPGLSLEGLILLPQGPMIVASIPILPSDQSGNVKGNVVFFHAIDEAFIATLKDQLQLNLTLDPVEAAHPELIEAKFAILSDDLIQASGTIQDLSGQPILTLTIQTDRETFNVGREGVNLVGGFIIVLSALCIMVLSLFMNSHFLSKLKYINETVNRIGTDKDFSKRLKMPISTDEFSTVIQEINGMLDDLEAAQKDHVFKANHDALTGLPNRRLLSELMNHALSKSQRDHTMLAVLFMDLDDFKDINDTHGHDVGDDVLIALSQQLSSKLRSSDVLARMGGDEFIVLLEDLSSTQTIQIMADKILDSIKAPIEIAEKTFTLSTSIGISIYPQDGQDSDTLIKNADLALYKAKEIGKARYAFFSDPLKQQD